MTTFIPFTPPITGTFQFLATFDGQQYNVRVTWNLYEQRWYLNIADQFNNTIVTRAVIGSRVGTNLTGLSWANGIVTATTVEPHGYFIGATADLNVSECTPDAYNGSVSAFIDSPTTFMYPLVLDPGPANSFGQVSYDINLIAGYFNTSTLVYRTANGQFEISP